MKTFFDTPTQVRFIEKEEASTNPRWLAGIAYQDYIICGECGHIVDLRDVISLVELGWVDLTDAII